MSCKGIHCPGCGDGGGVLVAIVAIVIIGAIVARPVEHAVGELVHVVLIGAAIAAAVSIAAAGAWLAVLLRRRTRRLTSEQRPVYVITDARRPRPVQDRAELRALPRPQRPVCTTAQTRSRAHRR